MLEIGDWILRLREEGLRPSLSTLDRPEWSAWLQNVETSSELPTRQIVLNGTDISLLHSLSTIINTDILESKPRLYLLYGVGWGALESNDSSETPRTPAYKEQEMPPQGGCPSYPRETPLPSVLYELYGLHRIEYASIIVQTVI